MWLNAISSCRFQSADFMRVETGRRKSTKRKSTKQIKETKRGIEREREKIYWTDMTVDVHMHWLIDLKIICFFVVFVNGLVAGSSKSYIQKSMSCYHWAQQTDFFLLFFERSFCVLVDFFFFDFLVYKEKKEQPDKKTIRNRFFVSPSLFDSVSSQQAA